MHFVCWDSGIFRDLHHCDPAESQPAMERGEERRGKGSEDEMPRSEQENGNEKVPAVSRGQEYREETQAVQRLLRAGADVTLCSCSCSRQTALHVSPPELRGKVLGWMTRPHLPPQMQLLQAAWQGDLQTLQRLLAQADRVDVNVPNSDGVTAVMLAVRDVDLFESIASLLPWQHRPVEVVKELLGLSADLRQRDHSGCCAPRYAADIHSPLKEELMHMMVEALSHTAPDQYSGLDLDSEFGDLDVELDPEGLYPNRPTAASPTQTPAHQSGFLLYSHTGEVLESPGQPPLSDHRKDLGHDKGIPLCFQNAMETLRDIRQAYQCAGTGSSRGGLSLPSLGDGSRRWSHLDAGPSPGLLSTRTPCLPVPPQNRPRTRSVVAASPSSPALRSVAEPGQLSQSAPSIMEPLLCSNTVMQARAHIQTRM
ncbi:uncharacterized protein [Clinocottus analis]|uniref:uncharacterized protein n=1 Tax=Clinocottus analis TaxID=304258 RepID=UPI0035C14A4C